MRQFIRKAIDIHPEELPQFAVLSSIYFVFILGLVWAENAIRAEVVEINLLAEAQLISSIFVVASAVFYTAFVDRIPKGRMVMLLSLIALVGIAGGTATLYIPSIASPITYLFLFILHRFLLYLWVIHWFTYIIDIYDTQAAKRIFPLLSAARPFASMIAGFSFEPVTNSLGVNHDLMMLIWVAIMAFVAVLFGFMPVILRRGDTTHLDLTRRIAGDEDVSGFQSLAEGFRYVATSSFLRWMAISALVLIAISTIVEFEAANLIDQLGFIQNSSQPTEAFASFTARIDGFTNAFVLVFQFLLFNRILRRIGLGNMNVIYPAIMFVAVIGLILAPLMAPEIIAMIAALNYANYRGVRRVLRDPAFALLNNAVPLHAKGRARSVINAILSPTGGIFAGVMLTTITQLPAWTLPAVLFALGLLYLISAFILRLQYTRAMVQILQQQSFSYLLAQRNEIGVTDSATMQILAENIKDSTDPDFKVFMASIIAEIGGRDSLPIIQDMIVDSDGEYRRNLVEVVYQTDIRTPEMRILYEELLKDDDPAVRQFAIRGLGRIIGSQDVEYLRLVQPHLDDSDIDVQASTITSLILANKEPYLTEAEQHLRTLLSTDNADYRRLGLEVIGSLKRVERIRDIMPFLDDPSDEVRLQATQAILALWKPKMPKDMYDLVLSRVDAFMDDRVERVRIAELTVLALIDVDDSKRALIRALGDPSPRVRDVAVTSLVKIGKSVEKLLERIATHDRGLNGKMASVTLSRIDNERYGELLDSHIESNLDSIYDNYQRSYALETCHEYSSVVILENAISDELSQQLDDLFELIAVRYDVESLDLIQESLRSTDNRTRSNAVEALESITTPQIARQIAPMMNPDMTTQALAGLRGTTQVETFDVLLRIAQSEDEWLRSVTLYAFGEIGRGHPDVRKIWSDIERDDAVTVAIDPCQRILNMDAVAVALRASIKSESRMVQLAAKAAIRQLRGENIIEYFRLQGGDTVLSLVERMIFLKKVSFFQGVAVDQLKVLANICEEEIFNAGDIIFREGVRGDSLYVVVNGMVGIGIFSTTSEDFTELAVYHPNSAFGEMTLFDNSPRSAAAVAKTDVLALKLRSEPLLALMYQEPDLSIELLRALSDNLRKANSRIASLTSTMRKSF